MLDQQEYEVLLSVGMPLITKEKKMEQDVFAQMQLNDHEDYEQARINMLKQQIRPWDVTDEKILKLFYKTPRQDFVPKAYRSLAFADLAIPLSHGQSMMTPKEEAKVLQELHIKEHDKIMVLGIDSGYMVAQLASLGKQVYYIDNDLDTFETVKQRLTEHHIQNVTGLIGSLNYGWQDIYPFDVIFLTGSLPTIPETLKNALSIKGRLFVTAGDEPAMEAMLIHRLSEHTWSERKLFETVRPRMLDVKEPSQFVF